VTADPANNQDFSALLLLQLKTVGAYWFNVVVGDTVTISIAVGCYLKGNGIPWSYLVTIGKKMLLVCSSLADAGMRKPSGTNCTNRKLPKTSLTFNA
jgi:hypothetical protein